ncbi:probable folate-biopterin transporter 6 [Ananas comosus]|uniref:Probable folate-biopterin transporter 6 n=1 Tax=Ananas comosus TaxID=4615 RepID=A0A6P5EB84_ANACO|nr:probable folate-biopterin transporter 6 [Ananas comosus]
MKPQQQDPPPRPPSSSSSTSASASASASISSSVFTTSAVASVVASVWGGWGWVGMLGRELGGSFVFGVVAVYGASQGAGGSLFRVASDYYWKDVQRQQPSAVQLFTGCYYVPWLLKPLWGLLTDLVPVAGYRRRPYFVLAGVLTTGSSLIVAGSTGLAAWAALVCFVSFAAAVAIADVTIDACIARNSIERPALAPDIQTLSGFVSALGGLVGYSLSGVLVHRLGSQGALGVIALPGLLLILLGFVINEQRTYQSAEKQKVWEKLRVAMRGMGKTIKYPVVWRPSLFMYLSLALSISITEGQFYWYTDQKAGPAFSQEFVGIIFAIGAMASMIGVLIYHKLLRDLPFRNLLFHAQLLYGASGMLDLVFVLRWNLFLGIPDYFFVVLEECCSKIIMKIRWIPMIVLSSKLCPLGIEGTFFALLMCIDSLGLLTAKTGGGIVLHALNVTRTDFENLWLAVLIRNLLRLSSLGLIFLVPRASQADVLLPPDILKAYGRNQEESLQLTKFNDMEDV